MERDDQQAGGVGETLTLGSAADDTIAAAGSGAPTAPAKVRAGGQADLDQLPPIDPRFYAVGAELARGGMGRILAARDRRLGRPVAIKELLRAAPGARARFEREARITARLQHPSIVSLYEAGRWPGGEPFYVMKLVEGKPLDKAIAGRGFEERLGLVSHVIAVVDALAYAHGKGVIHRDLKPSNVLIGDHGETVVIDWGLAKVLSETEADGAESSVPPASGDETVAGSVLGTPAYMPPEQARGEAVGPRADVYALGAILHHVLTGEPLYRGATTDEVLAQVLAAPPRPIAEVEPRVPPDLVTIVDKAIARDPAARYASAVELADDLKRFQTGQLVGAHRYTMGQLVRRWLRRHRVAVAVAGVMLAALAATLVVSVRRIVAERDEANRQRTLARANQSESEDLISFMLGDLRDRLAKLGRLDLLEAPAMKALAYYERRSDAGSDEQRAQRARAIDNLGQVLLAQGRTADALAQQRAALAIRLELAARHPDDPTHQHAVLVSRQRVGSILKDQGDFAGALAEYRQVLELADALVGREPGHAKWQQSRALGHRLVGDALGGQGDTDAALAEHRAALAIVEEHARRAPTDDEWQASLGMSHARVADRLATRGDQAGALVERRAALAITEQRLARDPGNADLQREVAFDQEAVARGLETVGQRSEALAEYRASLAILERLASVDPSDARVQGEIARRHSQIGNALLQEGKSAEALVEHQAALRLRERRAALNPTDTSTQSDLATTRERLGNHYKSMGKPDEALASYKAGLEIMERLAATGGKPDWNGDVAIFHGRIADVLDDRGDLDGALAEERLALERRAALVKRDPGNASWVYQHYASRFGIVLLMKKKGDVAGALAELRAALPTIEKLAAQDPKDAATQRALAVGRKYLGGMLVEQGDRAGALAALRQALTGSEALLAIDATNTTWQQDAQLIHAEIGEVHWNAKDYPRSLVEYRAALVIAEKLAEDPDDVDAQQGLAVACNDVADVLAAQRDLAGARAGYQRALAIAEALRKKNPTDAFTQALEKQVRGSLRSCCGR